MKSQKISITEKISYGLGDASANIFLGMTMMFLPYFCTNIVGISASAMGLLFIVARLWDAFIDPIVGNMADRTTTKYGKYRPFLLYFSVPYGLSCLLVFIAPNFSSTGNLIYVYVTYLFLTTMYAFTVVPYVALLTAITNDPQERLAINAWRFPLAKVAMLLCSTVVPIAVSYFGKANEAKAYLVSMSGIAILASLLLFICFKGTKEKIIINSEDKVSIRMQLKIIFTNKPTLLFVGFNVTGAVAFILKGSVAIYFVKYYLNASEQMVSVFLSAIAIAGIIAPMIAIQLIKKKLLSNIQLYKYANLFGGLATLSILIISPEQLTLGLFLIILSVIFAELGSIVCWALPSDCADYCEYKYSVKASGIMAAAGLFTQKVGFAIAGGIVGFSLALAGYDTNNITPNASFSILLLISVAPAVFHFLSFILLCFYPLNDHKMNEIKVALEQRS